MVIYEVHLATSLSIRRKFYSWLENHVCEILKLSGFTDANIYQPSSEFSDDLFSLAPDTEKWVVRYTLQSEEHLHEYLKIHAPRLRADGPLRFGDDLRIIGRRVLVLQKHLQKPENPAPFLKFNPKSLYSRRSAMRADMNAIKKELSRLANVDNLKKEINRIAREVKNFDDYLPLNNQAKQRLNRMEKRFTELMKSLAVLQKQIDENVNKFMKSMRGAKKSSQTARSSTTGVRKKVAKTSKKKTSRNPASKAKKTARRK